MKSVGSGCSEVIEVVTVNHVERVREGVLGEGRLALGRAGKNRKFQSFP